MRLHGNAALSWQGRRRLARRVVLEGWTLARAAEAAGVSVRCARRWAGRFRVEGEVGLYDRWSAPKRVPNRTSDDRVAAILGMALSTVSVVLKREGLGRLGRIGLEQPIRYECARPGELVRLDIKKLGRIEGGAGKRAFGDARRRATATYTDRGGHRRGRKGWEYVHIAVDDYSRLAYAEVLTDERASTAAGFLRRAIAHYRRHGIQVERILTDNGSCYRAATHALACKALGLRHTRTRPYHPQTNGKAERFIRTLLHGWAYGAIYRSSHEPTKALDRWLWHYNHRRKHSALGHQPPVTRTNLLGSYS